MPKTKSPETEYFHPPIDVFLYARHPEASLCLSHIKSHILQHNTLHELVTRFIEQRARPYHIDIQDARTLADSLSFQSQRLHNHATSLAKKST